jgi:hypothetical protein
VELSTYVETAVEMGLGGGLDHVDLREEALHS